jgi:hypothetical protein
VGARVDHDCKSVLIYWRGFKIVGPLKRTMRVTNKYLLIHFSSNVWDLAFLAKLSIKLKSLILAQIERWRHA